LTELTKRLPKPSESCTKKSSETALPTLTPSVVLGEVIEEYSEANDITPREVLYSLEYVYACVERYNDDAPAHKLY